MKKMNRLMREEEFGLQALRMNGDCLSKETGRVFCFFGLK